MKRLSQSEAIQRLESLGTGYDFSKFIYITSSSKSEVICSKGHSYKVSFSKFINGKRCPYCMGNHQWTQEEAIKNLEALNTGYDFSKFKYSNSSLKSTVTCNKGHSYEVRYIDFIKGNRCPYCSGKHKWTQEEAIKNLEALNTGYDFSKFKYISSRTQSTVTCNNGHSFLSSYTLLMNGTRCSYCSGKHKWTQEEAIARLDSLNTGYNFSRFIYKNTRTKGEIVCDKGHSFYMSFTNFQKGERCPYCANKVITPTTAIKNLEALNTGYDFSSFVYTTLTTKSKVVCNNGHMFSMSYRELLNGYRCPYCSGKHKWTQEEAIRNLESLGTGFNFSKFIYNGGHTKGVVICNNGHTFLSTYNNLRKGKGCPYCYGNHQWTQEEAIKNLNTLGTGYDFSLFTYKTSASRSTVICDKGHKFQSSYGLLMSGTRCTYCNKHHQWTQEEAIRNLKNLKTGYDFSEFVYINATSKSKVVCDKKHTFYASYDSLMGKRLRRCPICNESKGETYIQKWLKEHKIEFTFQKTFADLRYKYPLKYDFYVPSCKTLIEYNGIQHYEPVERFGGEEEFETQQIRYEMKRRYAEKKGYKFLEIPYTEYDNLDKILMDNIL